jgi:hypothetical protein
MYMQRIRRTFVVSEPCLWSCASSSNLSQFRRSRFDEDWVTSHQILFSHFGAGYGHSGTQLLGMSSPEIGTSPCTTSCFDTNQIVPIFAAMLATFLSSAGTHELVMAVVTKKIRCTPGKPPFFICEKINLFKRIVLCCNYPDSHDRCRTVASDRAEQVLWQRDDLVGVVCGVSVTVRSLRL